MSLVYLRILFGVLLFLALVVASVPLLVLISLAEGGSGYGLCPGGLGECTIGYLSPVEMSMWLVLVLFVLVALVRSVLLVWRRIERQQDEIRGAGLLRRP